jgi:hypothetical protein
VGFLRKQSKQDQGSGWVQPGQLIAQPAGPGAPSGPDPTARPPVPARLRLVTAAGHGDWLRGALRIAPGTLIWMPDSGVSASPVELATATTLPGQGGGRFGKAAKLVELQTPQGQFQLEMDPVLFEMTQELVAEPPPAHPAPAPP